MVPRASDQPYYFTDLYYPERFFQRDRNGMNPLAPASGQAFRVNKGHQVGIINTLLNQKAQTAETTRPKHLSTAPRARLSLEMVAYDCDLYYYFTDLYYH